MAKERTRKQIVPRIEVIVDGDVSSKRIEALIKLGREEERLDYKERFDFKSKSAAQRSKIDLVCDMVSMANTDGGYILVGVRQKTDGTFSIEKVDKTCLQRLTQENIQSWLGSYIDATIRFVAKPVKCRGKDVLAICIFRRLIPVPFRRNGQYQSKKGNPEAKFNEGEFFVRHGGKSERANYEDSSRFMEKVREDERRKVLSSESGQKDIVARLDTIIQLFGGVAPPPRGLDLLKSSEEEIGDRIAQVLALHPVMLKRLLKKDFVSVATFLEEQQRTDNFEELIENLNRGFIGFLWKLFPVWVTAIDYDHRVLAQETVDNLHKLYVKGNSINYVVDSKKIDSLWIQSRIIFLIYSLGAFAIVQDKGEFAKLLLNRGNPFNEYWRIRSWISYIYSMLYEAGEFKEKHFCYLIFDFVKDNPYIVNQFEKEDKIINALLQFDFLQCANTLAKGKDISECYYSFGSLYKLRIEPIVKKIIETCIDGSWIPIIQEPRCAEIIDELDIDAHKRFGFSYDWEFGGWQSKRIAEFLKKHRK